MGKQIKKPWIVYGGDFGAVGIGRFDSFTSSYKIVHLQTTEGRNHPKLCLEIDFVEFFEKSEDAVDYLSKKQNFLWEPPLSTKDISKTLLHNFPRALKQESIQTLHDTLVAYQNKFNEQSSPKCTGKENGLCYNCIIQEKSC